MTSIADFKGFLDASLKAFEALKTTE